MGIFVLVNINLSLCGINGRTGQALFSSGHHCMRQFCNAAGFATGQIFCKPVMAATLMWFAELEIGVSHPKLVHISSILPGNGAGGGGGVWPFGEQRPFPACKIFDAIKQSTL